MSQEREPADHDHQTLAQGRALSADFDHDPERFAANQLATLAFSIIGDVHDRVADRLAKITNGPILDLGGGDGALAKSLARHGRSAIVVDRADYVRGAPRPAVQADATRLPFRAECFAAVAALWMLYYLDRPEVVLIESTRVLRPGGTFVACTSSRYNDPEFASLLPNWGEPFSFDAETAPEIISDHFKITEVITWDTPAVRLPDRAAVALFLRGRGLSAEEASLQARQWNTPLTVTKRGRLIWARRPPRSRRRYRPPRPPLQGPPSHR
jgi:SAM-dependent methyltransferase